MTFFVRIFPIIDIVDSTKQYLKLFIDVQRKWLTHINYNVHRRRTFFFIFNNLRSIFNKQQLRVITHIFCAISYFVWDINMVRNVQ